MQNDNAIWLISGWSRCRVTFDEDGFIYNMGSSGAADNIYAVYAIGEDESSLKVRDYYFSVDGMMKIGIIIRLETKIKRRVRYLEERMFGSSSMKSLIKNKYQFGIRIFDRL